MISRKGREGEIILKDDIVVARLGGKIRRRFLGSGGEICRFYQCRAVDAGQVLPDGRDIGRILPQEANRPVLRGLSRARIKHNSQRRGSEAKEGSAVVLSLRTLSYTPERWEQFWSKVDRWGFPFAA